MKELMLAGFIVGVFAIGVTVGAIVMMDEICGDQELYC